MRDVFREPEIQIDGLDFADVRAHFAMKPTAADADKAAEVDGCPSRRPFPAICAALVLFARKHLGNLLLVLGLELLALLCVHFLFLVQIHSLIHDGFMTCWWRSCRIAIYISSTSLPLHFCFDCVVDYIQIRDIQISMLTLQIRDIQISILTLMRPNKSNCLAFLQFTQPRRENHIAKRV